MLAVGVLLACGSDGAQRGSVEVAVAAPLDELGTMDDARRAWQLVASEINDAGGINGRTLRVHERDTPLTDPNDTAPIADGFVDLSEQGYRYIISLVSGAALEPVMRAATTYDVLALSITSEDSATALPSTDGLLLRGVLPTDRVIDKQATALQAAGLINILSIGPTRSGVPDARLSAMSAAYAGCTACSATELTYPAEADLYSYDWQSFGARAMTRPALAQPPQVVYLAIADAQVLLDVVRSLDVAGYTGLYYFAYAGYLPWVIPAFKPSLYQRFRSYDLALPPSPELDQFSALYSERYGDSFVPEPRLLAFTDYLALLALAMDQVGDTDPGLVAAKVKQIASPPGTAYGPLEYRAAQSALRAGQDINYQGLSGALDFDANGEVSDGFIQEYGVNTDGDVVALP